MRVTVRDGVIESGDTAGMYAFVDIPFREWRPNMAYS